MPQPDLLGSMISCFHTGTLGESDALERCKNIQWEIHCLGNNFIICRFFLGVVRGVPEA